MRDHTGQEVLQKRIEVYAGIYELTIDCAHLSNGLYYLQVEGRGAAPLKIVIE